MDYASPKSKLNEMLPWSSKGEDVSRLIPIVVGWFIVAGVYHVEISVTEGRVNAIFKAQASYYLLMEEWFARRAVTVYPSSSLVSYLYIFLIHAVYCLGFALHQEWETYWIDQLKSKRSCFSRTCPFCPLTFGAHIIELMLLLYRPKYELLWALQNRRFCDKRVWFDKCGHS